MTSGTSRCLVLLALSLAGGCASHGREVFVREGCVSCHTSTDLPGGGLGPNLTEVATRRDGASLRAKITGSTDDPASRMPSFKSLSWFDLHSLVAYLRS